MDLTPEDQEHIHREKRERENADRVNGGKPTSGLLTAFVMIGLVFALFLIGVHQKDPAYDLIDVGGDAILYTDEFPSVWVAVDPDAFDEMVNAAAAGDASALVDLAFSGKIFEVENRVKVKVISQGPRKRKVRILKGKQVGRSGWVPREWVR